jgi:hypothetical protein
MYTFWHHIHPPIPFPYHLSPLTGASPLSWAGPIPPSCSPIL